MPNPKFICKMDDCELAHCIVCGEHFDPYSAEGRDTCPDCQVAAAGDKYDKLAKGFGGNYEALNAFLGD